MKTAFFFDRDGVLNHIDYRYEPEYEKYMDCAPIDISNFNLDCNAQEIIKFVSDNGFIPIVATNQPDFLKKEISLKIYEEITTKLCLELGFNRNQIFECLHKEGISLECGCKKPKPGLFFMAKNMHDLDLENSWMIGDSWKDIVAANEAGIKNLIFLKRKSVDNKSVGNQDSLKKIKRLGIGCHVIDSLKDVKKIVE